MKFQDCLYRASFLLGLAISAACGGRDNANAVTQVAAKVNGDEITVHQISDVLARSQDIAPEAAAQAKREILDGLIDRQVAQQQAIARKLDRSPRVMQAIEAAKGEILARVYLDQIAADQREPTAGDIKKYYADHPELFAQRRLFTLEEVIVLPQPGLASRLRERVATARSMQEIATWLKSQDARFEENRGVRAAEEIPLDLLPKLQAMKQDELSLIDGGGRLNVFRLVAVQARPVDESTASPRIRQLLFNQRRAEAIATEMAQFRRQSKIEYFGEFANRSAAAANAEPALPAMNTMPVSKSGSKP